MHLRSLVSNQTPATGSTRRHLYGVWLSGQTCLTDLKLQLECVIKVLRPWSRLALNHLASIAHAQGSQLHNWSLKKATWIHWLWKLAENCEPQCGVSWLLINVRLCNLKGRKGQRLCQRVRGSQNTYREMTRQMTKKGNIGLSTGFPHLQFISSCHDVLYE